VVGRPFQKGDDPRRHTPEPGTAKTLRALARSDRQATVDRLKELRDQDDDPRVALEASKLLAAYSDGAPTEKNVPDEPEEDATPEAQAKDAEVLKLIQPPEVE
jgi:hypothetical protein